jgi:hypothetical protein
MHTLHRTALLMLLLVTATACGAQNKRNDVWNNYDSHRTVVTEGASSPSGNDETYRQPHGFGTCTSLQTLGCE